MPHGKSAIETGVLEIMIGKINGMCLKKRQNDVKEY